MRILLVHNPKAGDGDHEADQFLEALKKAGHETVYQSSKEKGIKKAFQLEVDLVLAAGGDGLVGKVAQRLIGRQTPMSVLPLGTANNLARSLGFAVSPKKLIAQLDRGARRGFDVGVARGPWGRRYFFEGAGAGLFADYLRDPKEIYPTSEPISKAEEMKRHIVELRRELQDYRARRWEIVLDGKDLSGNYLLWQALNIRSIGPVLTLAPAAHTNDGRLDFVAAREEDRTTLLEYLDARLAGVKRKFPLKVKRFQRMRVWCKKPLHFDDTIWPESSKKPPEPCQIEFTVRPAALGIWTIRK